MVKKSVYRMSPVVVWIGYLFLIPSVLGWMLGMLMFLGILGGAGNAPAVAEFMKAGAPEATAELLAAQPEDPEGIIHTLPIGVQQAVIDCWYRVEGGSVGKGLAGFFSVLLALGSFMGGIFGWLLVMKKKVLQCDYCEAVVAAS